MSKTKELSKRSKVDSRIYNLRLWIIQTSYKTFLEPNNI